MNSWKIIFIIVGIYLALSGVGVQAQIDPTYLMEGFEENLEDHSEKKMEKFDEEEKRRRVAEGDKFDEERHQSERDAEQRRIRRMFLEKTRSMIEEAFQDQRAVLESNASSFLDWNEFEESERIFYEWLEEQYDALELVSPSANILQSAGDSRETWSADHKTADRVGEGYPYKSLEDDKDLSTRDDPHTDDDDKLDESEMVPMSLAEYDYSGREVFSGKMELEQHWHTDRLSWPVWEGEGASGTKEILNSSFMDPSWTGVPGHTYPGHTGMDIGYFTRDKHADPWTKETYESEKSDFAYVYAAKGGEVVLANDQEGDACGYWLLSPEGYEEARKNPPKDAKFEKSDECGGGCYHGNCAGNYVVIDHDPKESGLLDRAGFRYTTYMHLQKDGVVQVGTDVLRGDAIGRMGSSGQSLSPHLHFEVHKELMDPKNNNWQDYLNSLVDPFYSEHSSNNPTFPEGSSKWRNQCYRDSEKMYGSITGSYFPTAWSFSNLELDAGLTRSGENWKTCGPGG